MSAETSATHGDIVMDMKRQSTATIRNFSHEPTTLEADSQLGPCLEQAVEDRFGSLYKDEKFDAVPETTDIEVQYQKLSAQCSEFWDSLAKEETDVQLVTARENSKRNAFMRIAGRKKHGKDDKVRPTDDVENVVANQPVGDGSTPKEGSSVSIEDVKAAVSAVYNVQGDYNNKPRKAWRYLHQFCNKLNSHSNLFSMLPNQNQYCSIFCGAVKTLIQASVNHCKVAEDLGKALNYISKELDLCVDTLKIWNRHDVQGLVGELYSYIFHFLRCAIKWFQSKRIKRALNAFNENFFETFEDHIENIRQVSAHIRHKTAIKTQAELKDVREVVIKTQRELNAMHSTLKEDAKQRMEERVAKRDQRHLSRMGEQEWSQFASVLGNKLIGMLESNFEEWYFSGSKLLPKQAPETAKTPIKPKHVLFRNKLQLWSRHLEDYMSDMSVFLYIENTKADINVINALQDWSRSPNSQQLWICTSEEEEYPSTTTGITSTVLSMALRSKIPVLVIFCDIHGDRDVDGGEEPLSREDWEAIEAAALVNLAYSMIRQIIALLPDRLESKRSLTKAGFHELDGSLETWDTGIRILKTLLKLAPRTMLVGIDGLDQFGSEWHEYIDDILDLFSEFLDKDRYKKTKSYKILFTTSRRCEVLERLDENEIIEVAPRWRRRGQLSIEEEF